MATAPPPPVLDVQGLRVALGAKGRRVPVVEGVTLSVAAGRVLSIVGESGSGKSVTALAAMGLLEPGASEVRADRLALEGRDLLALREEEWRRLRGGRMAMVFQEPMTSLNPVFPVLDQVAEAARAHPLDAASATRAGARERAAAALAEVGIPPARHRAFPHELSGGMRQRAMIAMALAGDPALLIADEPTTALDVTVQAQILALLADLRARRGMAILLVTHNLGVVAEAADEVAVMYAGAVVERAPASALFRDAQHPYTLALLGAMPEGAGPPGAPLAPIPGRMPAPGAWPEGCRFRARCPFAVARCAEEAPALRPVRGGEAGHLAACHRAPLELAA